jgi:drug/metabolite transporter (DMT)-like permease
MNTSPAGKTTALIAYAPFVGFLIAFFINQDEKHEYATWHIKNMFGLSILFIVALVVQSQINLRAGDILWLLCCFLWIYCWIMAFLNKQKGIPFFSEKFQKWFTFLN